MTIFDLKVEWNAVCPEAPHPIQLAVNVSEIQTSLHFYDLFWNYLLFIMDPILSTLLNALSTHYQHTDSADNNRAWKFDP